MQHSLKDKSYESYRNMFICSSNKIWQPQSVLHTFLSCTLFSSKVPKVGDKMQRVARILHERNVGTRSEIAKLLKQGAISVRGTVVRSEGVRFSNSIPIEVNRVLLEETPLLALYCKPIGVHW